MTAKVTRRAALGGATGILLGAGCGDDSAGTGGGGGTSAATGPSSTATGVDDLADVVYEGEASDEALRELHASAPINDASQAAQFLTPAEGTVLDRAAPAPPEFTWGVGASTHLLPPRGREPRSPKRHRTHDPSLTERALGLVLGVRDAHAHGAPTNGRAYLLVFATASNSKLLRVFTTALSYTPDAFAWDALTGATEAISVRITNAIFEQNRITAGGGPYVGPALVLGE